MKVLGSLCLINLLFLISSRVEAQPKPGFRPLQLMQQRRTANRVMCTQDSLMIYNDCRMCVCPRPNRPAKCFRKTCDLRTKDTGQCPTTMLKMDDNKLCPGVSRPMCRADNECPGDQVCCFDFCKGHTCVNPVPMAPGVSTHPGRGYQ